MKRAISFLLVLVMCLSLCACGKSQSVKDVENAIKAIGEVSLDSNDAILKAERLYDNLTDSEKSEVENKAALVEARFTYDKFYNDKVYDIAKEAYELLCEAEKMYCFIMNNWHDAGLWGMKNNLSIHNKDLCKKLADVSIEYIDYPKLTEAEVRDALELYCNDKSILEDKIADNGDCMNIIMRACWVIRDYSPKNRIEDAGKLIIELEETYKDVKYSPALAEYRDYVATGEIAFTSWDGNFDALLNRFREYQSENSQFALKLSPMFAN